MKIDDHGAELLVAAIIERAIEDHTTAAKKIKNADKIHADYLRWEPMYSWALRHKNKKRRNKVPVADKVARKTLAARRRYDQMRESFWTIEEVERFFVSDYFHGISQLNGFDIINGLQEREETK